MSFGLGNPSSWGSTPNGAAAPRSLCRRDPSGEGRDSAAHPTTEEATMRDDHYPTIGEAIRFYGALVAIVLFGAVAWTLLIVALLWIGGKL